MVKRVGDRLYALSAIGGLSIVDIANPNDLKLLGRFRATATPFEMYVKDEVAFVLYNGFGVYEFDDAAQQFTYYQTSYVLAIDVSDPKRLAETQRFEIPGYISDSRLVGDALYVVAYDDAYCYSCGNTPQTHVMSLNVSDPTNIVKVDEVNFEEREGYGGWGRSLSGNDQRLYMGGPRYGVGTEPEGSTIQVIDISDPSGDMQAGATLEVAGQINSRWQMDEYEGVLRVVSQPLSFTQASVPAVETFEIVSSAELALLGSIDLVLPEPETLRAVRFDGSRAYAITFRETDPLFTIDLSDPAHPVQAGELEMPGWVYHMEPRGDRLIGLGYDQGNAGGSLTLSLFDVSELGAPTMIDRVNFGGDWGSFSEDQNRIHKSFQVLDEAGLVLIPYSGHDFDQCAGASSYRSGVQLVDFSADDLALAGVAEVRGQARRAFLHEERLLTMSDERVETFDISDRNTPESTSHVELAQIVNQLEVAGDTIVRVGTSQWSAQRGLEVSVSNLEDLVALEPGVTVTFDDINTVDCSGESYLNGVFASDDRVYFHYTKNQYADLTKGMRIKVLDVADPTDPEVVADVDVDYIPPELRYATVPGMVHSGSASLALGNALVFTNHNITYNDLGFIVKNEPTLDVLDFNDANKPKRKSIPMPPSLGATGLVASGNVIATSHFEAVADDVDAVRFYLDRVDVSEPSDPVVLDSLNIPGSLLTYDDRSKRALTLDYRYATFENISPAQCYEEEFGAFVASDPSLVDYETGRGPCTALRLELHLVDVSGKRARIVDSHELAKGTTIRVVALGDDRAFLGIGTASGGYLPMGPVSELPRPAPWGGIGVGVPYYRYSAKMGSATVLVASGLDQDSLKVASVDVATSDTFYGFSSILAKGKKAVIAAGWQNQMSVVDATDASEPVSTFIEVPAGVQDLDLVGDTVVAALGPAGVQTLVLGD